jgi:hypothetical protein
MSHFDEDLTNDMSIKHFMFAVAAANTIYIEWNLINNVQLAVANPHRQRTTMTFFVNRATRQKVCPILRKNSVWQKC